MSPPALRLPLRLLHSIGVETGVSQAVQLLQRKGMLKVVHPASVLQAYEGPMAAAIRADLGDRALRHLLGDFARSVAGELSRYVEAAGTNPADVIAFAQTGQACDEIRLGPNGLKESTAMLRV